ncbi:MAG: gliding motility-associated C-terminal domain-containing protein [Chitinophagaceae bacterium]
MFKRYLFYQLFYIIVLVQFESRAQSLVYQSHGGAEFRFQHRPDIADSAYQLFLRINAAAIVAIGSSGPNAVTTSLVISPNINIHDTDTYHYYSYFFKSPVYPTNNYINNNNTTKTILNPFTGDSAGKWIFKNCTPNFNAGALQNGVAAGGNAFNNTTLYIDTFEHIRDIWYDTIIYLPEKSGLWQVMQYSVTNNNLTCGWQGPTGFVGKEHTNLDTTNNYFYPGQPWFYASNFYTSGGIAQINTLVPNSNPYFLSYPTGVFYKNVPSVYKQLAVDPDGDSLVFSSIHMVFPDTMSQGSANYNNQKEFALFDNCYNQLPPYDTNYTGFVHSPYTCIPGTGNITNCITYDPIYNPFDTDSTFWVDPHNGDVHFTAKSAFQTAALLLRCDEYRQGVWVGSVNRFVDFMVFDSTYSSSPSFYIDSNNLVNCIKDSDYAITACAGSTIAIPFIGLGAEPGLSHLAAKDNHSVSIPASNVSYMGIGTDSVHGVLNWAIPANATGEHVLLITLNDSICSKTPYLFDHNYLLRIHITHGINTGSDTSICQGQSLTLMPKDIGNNTTVNWTVLTGNANSLSCTSCINPIATPSQTTTYVAQIPVSASSSCKTADTITVYVIPDFSIQASDTTICKPEIQIPLHVQSSINSSALSYQWTPNTGVVGSTQSSTLIINPATTQYIVTVSDTSGCFTHTDTATVVYDNGFTANISVSPQDICTGDTVAITVAGTGISTVAWSPDYHISSLSGNSVFAWPDTNHVYQALIQSQNSSCKLYLDQAVYVTALRADAGPDRSIFDGESLILGGADMLCGEGCTVQWYPDKYLVHYLLLNPKATPPEDMTYWVKLSSAQGGCEDRDTMQIHVKCTDIYLPNAFNPRSDVDNNHFGPRNISIELKYFRIFNRWGEMVFSTNDVGQRWDGTYQGKAQPMDTYIWTIEGKCPNGEWIQKKGNVTLVR